MISVAQAQRLVLKNTCSFGSEPVKLELALNRVLAEPVLADRDLPPFNRSTMDGIALKYKDFAAGQRKFKIVAVQAAGQAPVRSLAKNSCLQIMTGAALPTAADTVVPIEEMTIKNGQAQLTTNQVVKGQFIHHRGADVLKGKEVLPAGQLVTPAAIPIAATMGKSKLTVAKLPRVVVVSTGNELVAVNAQPNDHQIRRSNNYAIQASLLHYGTSVDMLHLPDSLPKLRKKLKNCLKNYDAIIISGGVSKGLYDFIPQVLQELSVKVLFHGVGQKPGKPFWFGVHPSGPVVCALPGNPVSTFLCMQKYVLAWLEGCLGLKTQPASHAILSKDVKTGTSLHCFLQVKLRSNKNGQLVATPLAHNGSGDFLSLLQADAFIELPTGQTIYKKGQAYKLLPLRPII